jgi:beta-ureidopropionase / N-carbamoyl-L-amino-acid hydrolase
VYTIFYMTMKTPLTLTALNSAPEHLATQMLDGLFEHSPWIAQQALALRPFKSLSHLKHCFTQVLEAAGPEAQVKLIRAHPELAGKAMVSNSLTEESSNEQSKAGLTHCSPAEFAKIKQLNTDYNAKFGWPFILAVRGARGMGLDRQQIITTFERRLNNSPSFEMAECIRNIHRIVEIRLNDKFGTSPILGNELWDWHESLAQFSDAGFKEKNQLTVTYLTPAHRACSQHLMNQMRECGFDEVSQDAVGNVVGRYYPATRTEVSPKYLLTGSHFDTVRNGGKYDGRLGIFVPMMCVRELAKHQKRLPVGIEVVAFSEEEGQRYKATFLGSGALVGQFNPAWLQQTDADGISMRSAMTTMGLDPEKIASIQRNAADYVGFVEVHIEQGPVLNGLHIPLGVVTSINGSVRYIGTAYGVACHAGTTPMDKRHDAALAVAELGLYMERRACEDRDSVATIGLLSVPNGSINVVPGQCSFSLDMRAPNDAQRDALCADVLVAIDLISEKRGVRFELEKTMQVAAAPSDSLLQKKWEYVVSQMGLPSYKMPSGAGHDAMKLHEIMPQAMLFVRGENSGISHNPLESTSSDDMQLCVEAFQAVLTTFH